MGAVTVHLAVSTSPLDKNRFFCTTMMLPLLTHVWMQCMTTKSADTDADADAADDEDDLKKALQG